MDVKGQETVCTVPIRLIDDFAEHPFQVRDDKDMERLIQSIDNNGVLNPVILRKNGERYELIAGHRRKHACLRLGISGIPAIVRELSRDEAVVEMVDSNLQREHILPSEKAYAYKMKMDAMKRKAGRPKENSRPLVEDFSTADLRNTYSNRADIYIDCSKPLIDEKDTFKYTIQNAFDKNPATSYVEDTEDDFMYISFGSQRQLEKIALINGYTVNEKLYKMNNRIKDIACESMNDKNYEIVINNRFSLKDLIHTYQILELNTQANYTCIPSIIIESYYKGSSYSDTCIAEVDYLFQKDGWLFGGIN